MKSSALLFGVAILFTLGPASALATTTPTSTPSYPRPTCMLQASSGSVALGKTVNLSWQSQYATQGFITSIGTVGTVGTQGVIPTGRGTTYVGTFTGPGGTGNCSITISITQPNSFDGGGNGDEDTIDGPGTVVPPDRLAPSPGGTSPTTLPPANDITLSTQSGGLVSCGNTTGLTPGTPEYYAAATNCQACNLASLAQRIINFLLGLSIPLAAAMFAWAGVVYFTASTTGSIEKAHKIFKSVGIGFGIVLCAWLGVNTVLKTILNPNMFKEGSWFTIECVHPKYRPTNAKISDLLSVLPGLNTNALTPVPTPSSQNYGGQINPLTGCAEEDYFSEGTCTNAFGGTYKPSSTANCDPELGCYSNPGNANIGDAAWNYYNTDTSLGPDHGNKACAWAVNQILQGEGIDPIDNNLVESMERELSEGGRGTYVNTEDAHKGDIVIWKTSTVSHVGICYDENCSQVISNSSGNRAFNNISGTTFNGVPGRIYRVNR